ncbi:MAG: AMP-binding protein [Pseudomonadales bacterium]
MYEVRLKESFFPAQSAASLQPQTVYEMMAQQACRFGHKDALLEITSTGDSGRSWTYSALHEEAERLARALSTRHRQSARVAIFANNLPEWVLMELACAYAGLVLVTVNPSLRAAELHYILEQSKAEAIYYAAQVRGSKLRDVIDAAIADADQPLICIELEDEVALFAGWEQGVPRETSPEDVVQIQYTSGTTGFPKGAQLHQHGLVASGRDILRRVGVHEGARVPGYMPLFHTSGCGIMTLGGLGCGATILLMHDFDPVVALQLVEAQGVTFLSGVPTMLVAIFDVAEKTGRDLSQIKGLMSGGSVVAAELNRRAQKLCGVPVLNSYGQTEASPGIAGTWPDDTDEDICETIGQPYPHIDVAILKPGSSDICPLQEQGEICVRGYNVMTAYNNNPAATRDAIDKEGWLHTGDLGSMDARGYIRITGRVKEMIIRGGENLFPAEIENAMLAHPGIAEVAVVGVPDEKWGELVACFMRIRALPDGNMGISIDNGSDNTNDVDARPSAEELKKFIRARLSPQKTPAYWIWVSEWPLTGSGKIRKFVLREKFLAGEYQILTA